MWAKVDERGRVYLPKSVRSRIGKEVFVVEVKDGILLIPKPADPIKELEKEGKKLPSKSIEDLRREIVEEAMEEIE
ncbi:transcriptional regulator, AbrB family [Ferroglobus placidus DSM 10642]|uniref:Transcriptional regulator, AbrB family n=1 Tax=Ferroglobus placidus (strain DSM 10642 / AEDII12DO) TaxID=589924 RepID=D3RYJ0_FERPA|nr:AbrB/MazE/SpoVT family DNA-binding domain-containing protein [Ferroglobus placidus]ADC65553.1 transcriptional regulator, AbrB family [Ferroglobus placidus DSM 10642]